MMRYLPRLAARSGIATLSTSVAPIAQHGVPNRLAGDIEVHEQTLISANQLHASQQPVAAPASLSPSQPAERGTSVALQTDPTVAVPQHRTAENPASAPPVGGDQTDRPYPASQFPVRLAEQEHNLAQASRSSVGSQQQTPTSLRQTASRYNTPSQDSTWAYLARVQGGIEAGPGEFPAPASTPNNTKPAAMVEGADQAEPPYREDQLPGRPQAAETQTASFATSASDLLRGREAPVITSPAVKVNIGRVEVEVHQPVAPQPAPRVAPVAAPSPRPVRLSRHYLRGW